MTRAFVGDEVVSLARSDWDVTERPPSILAVPDLVLHAAAWTDVDGAEADPEAAAKVNVHGTRNAAELGAPLVYFSTDYVFDGRKREPYVESDPPNPLSVYGRTKLDGEAAAGEDAWIVRTSWLFGEHGQNFVRTILRLGGERDEVRVVSDQRGSPTYVWHLAEAVRELVELPAEKGTSPAGVCTWAEFGVAICEEARRCRVVPVSIEELGAVRWTFFAP